MNKERVYIILCAIMLTCYLTANVMAVKIIQIGNISIFDAGTILFPITYLLGAVVTEVWGIERAKKMIWLTFACQILFIVFTWIGTLLPYPDDMEEMATAYAQVFHYVPRIMAASLAAFLVGELTNAHVMVKIKQHFGGPLWVRTIGSSLIGYSLDTTIFVVIAFAKTVSVHQLWTMIIIQIAAKLLFECVASTPLAYLLIGKIQKMVH